MSELLKKEECQPLKNLTEVLQWTPNQSDWSRSVIKLSSRAAYCYDGNSFNCHKKSGKPVKILNNGAPKTLLCHDMKGNYLDDKFVDGSVYNYQYLFYHWSVVDTFVYFSHHFITIPPLMWINAAHVHGVKILGTIITEHNDGKKIWNLILNDLNTLNVFVDKLVEICEHYRFDGYLINIENEIDKQLLKNLEIFLKNLRLKMENVGILIWYDAVSFIDGKLNWQNELNQHNKLPFEYCDGIFLNYAWKDMNLQNSWVNAGVRQYDVYVGVDVFGRGCFGGGGFNTDLAMNVIRSFGLSVAIFGCGWTHETQANDIKFFNTERKFWIKLWPYLFIHVPASLPFRTTFNQGIDIQSSKGDVLWYNLSSQSFQLSLPSCSDIFSEQSCISHCFNDSFCGGSCIQLNKNEKKIEMHRLVLCNFVCLKTTPLYFTVTAKSVNTFTSFQILLTVQNSSRNCTLILFISKEMAFVLNPTDFSCSIDLSKKINTSKEITVDENGWVSNKFYLKFDGTITEISVKTEESIMIGYISLE